MKVPAGEGSKVTLLHDYRAVDDAPEAVELIEAAVDHNSTAELAALKHGAELGDLRDELQFTFSDSQRIHGSAEDVSTVFPLPSFDNSAMDGYAVRAVDTRAASAEQPAQLQVVGDIAAGAKTRSGMGPGLAHGMRAAALMVSPVRGP